MHSIAGLPFWSIAFDRAGSVYGPDESAFIHESAAAGVTDLLIFSHGWNNDAPTASGLYENFFALVPPLLEGRADPERTIGLVGVYWPSMRWPDEVGTDPTGATAAVDLAAGLSAAAAFAPVQQFAAPPPPSAAMRALLEDAFPAADPAQIADLLTLLETRPDDESELRRLRDIRVNSRVRQFVRSLRRARPTRWATTARASRMPFPRRSAPTATRTRSTTRFALRSRTPAWSPAQPEALPVSPPRLRASGTARKRSRGK